jgi:hypothetical protein
VLLLVRVGLPVGVAVAGIVLIAAGSDADATGMGVVLIGVAGLVVLANVLVRLSISSQEDRVREQRARRRFTRTGRWPTA